MKKETGMSTRAAFAENRETKGKPPPSPAPSWEELDDDSLDDFFAVQEADIDDFSRGGK